MRQDFEFDDAGRTFACEQKSSRGASWWWSRVSTDDRHRYAPFRTEAEDTERSVASRVVAYYDDLMTRRGAPPRR